MIARATAWDDLAAVALLGTDRRDPPPPPPGPLAAFALESPATDPAGALVQQIAALTLVERAAAPPSPAQPLLVPAALDPRPMCSPEAGALLRRIVLEWPMLEDEWLSLAAAADRRLAPDLIPMLLRRHRADPERRALVCRLAGPVADWLTEHVEALAPSPRRAAAPAVVGLPPELAAVMGESVERILAVIVDGLRRQRYTMPSRAVVVHAIACLAVDRLDALASGLDALDPDLPGRGLVHHLLDLVEVRRATVRALAPAQEAP